MNYKALVMYFIFGVNDPGAEASRLIPRLSLA